MPEKLTALQMTGNLLIQNIWGGKIDKHVPIHKWPYGIDTISGLNQTPAFTKPRRWTARRTDGFQFLLLCLWSKLIYQTSKERFLKNDLMDKKYQISVKKRVAL